MSVRNVCFVLTSYLPHKILHLSVFSPLNSVMCFCSRIFLISKYCRIEQWKCSSYECEYMQPSATLCTHTSANPVLNTASCPDRLYVSSCELPDHTHTYGSSFSHLYGAFSSATAGLKEWCLQHWANCTATHTHRHPHRHTHTQNSLCKKKSVFSALDIIFSCLKTQDQITSLAPYNLI